MSAARSPAFNYTRITFIVLAVLLVVRVAGIIASPLNLGPDEAQYWRWAQTLDWGYYSKPPLIAWVIAASTSLFGSAEWAVRLPAPFLHTLAAGVIFVLARAIYDARVGAYASIGYALMPGVVLSSGLMTTDGILLPIWALALLALWKLREAPANWRWAIALGGTIALGFLAKYAMVYFLIGMIAASLFDAPTRAALCSRRGGLVAGAALLLLLPHLVWSAANEFQTLEHTADNARWDGPLFHPDHALRFMADQMGIVGPIGFAVLVTASLGILRPHKSQHGLSDARWLLCFCLPAIVIILVQAVTSRAHANWAVTAYVAGSILIAHWVTRASPWRARGWVIAAAVIGGTALVIPDLSLGLRVGIGGTLGAGILLAGYFGNWQRIGLGWLSFALHAGVAAAFMALAIGPVSWSEALELGQSFKRTRGWPATNALLEQAARTHEADAIMVDEREHWHGFDYYGRQSAERSPLYMWQRNVSAKSYAEGFTLPDGFQGRVLIANGKPHLTPAILRDFQTITRVGDIDVPLYSGGTRHFDLFVGEGFTPPERSADWNARLEAEVDAWVAANR